MNRYTNALTVALPLALAACGGSSPSSNPNGAASATASPAIPLGKTGKAAGVEVTVTKVTTPRQLGATGVGPRAEAGETFVVVSYTLKNASAEALPFPSRPALTLVDGKGQSYAPDPSDSMMSAVDMADPSGMAPDLNPGVSAKARAAWKVDAKAFDRSAWRLAAGTDPQLAFALK